MMPPHDEREPERDVWLSEALRHAPDAHAVPPAEISEAILRQARNAVKVPQAAAPARTNPLLQFWAWLARPPIAAGFATMMVATLVGVMWWDRPFEETLPPREVPAASRETPPPQAAAPASAPEAAPMPPPAQAQAPTRGAAPAPAPAAKHERAATGRIAAPADDARARGADAAPPAAAAAPEPAPFASATPAATADAARPDEARGHDAANERRGALAKAAPPPARLALRAQPRDGEATTPVIDNPRRWTWQRDAGVQAMTPALQRWLAQLDRVARWHAAQGAVPDGANGRVLRLWRDGALHTTITLRADAVWLTPADGAAVVAPLTPEAAAALEAALIEAGP